MADPNDSRQTALRCVELARTARTPELKRTLTERARLAIQHAIELERNMGLSLGPHPADTSAGHDHTSTLRDQLEAANLRLAESERLVAGWREIIAEGVSEGPDSRNLLRAFEAHVQTYRA